MSTTDLSVYDQKIADLTKKITTCEGSMAEFNASVADFVKLAQNFERNYAAWQIVDKRYTDWVTARDTFVRGGITLTGSWIWDGLNRVDCNTVGTIDYRGLFGESYGMKNCNDVPGSVQAKCTASGYNRCACTAGLDSWCATSKRGQYQTIDPGTFMNTKYYKDWLAANPQPPSAGAPPQPPPAFSPSVNMVCTYCSQTIDMSNITSSAGALQLQIGANAQVQNCIASLNQQKSEVSAQQAAAAKAIADKAAADAAAAKLANDAAAAKELADRAAAANAIAASAAQTSQQSAAAAVAPPKTQQELEQSHAAAVDTARGGMNIGGFTVSPILLFVLIIFVIIAAVVAYQMYIGANTGAKSA
jgi:hypothetical protein